MGLARARAGRAGRARVAGSLVGWVGQGGSGSVGGWGPGRRRPALLRRAGARPAARGRLRPGGRGLGCCVRPLGRE
eukprot:12972665-Alexandrium_andersonii.AAC.1